MSRSGTVLLLSLTLLIGAGAGASVVSKVTQEALEATVESAAKKSGRALDSDLARRAAVEQVEGLTKTYGDDVLKLVEDGGLEFVEAVPKYGDEMVKFASKATPQARRVLALNPEELVPLSRRVGVEALELEAKVPGQASNVFRLFGDDGGKYVAKNVPTEDLPRLIKYGEMADSDATRRALLEAYEKEGKSLFERIPPKLVLAGGLTAAMLYGVHEASDIARENPGFLSDIINHATSVGGIVLLVAIVLLFWRFGLMPWQRKSQNKNPSSK
ncbi:MAG: hypothetical protein NT025_00080 [bacterium]|nr:hypothetical protein [bacterium]